jgi:Icc protein
MFKVIQITDCHLLADRRALLNGINTFESLANVLRHVRRHHQDARRLLLTGDLSQDGSADSYRLLQDLVGALDIPAAALPGNHDRFSLMRSVFDPEVIACPHHLDLEHWQVLLLDSTVPGETGGFLHAAELDWLRRRLRLATQPALVALHHPAMPVGSPWMDRVGLKNSAELLSILTAAPHVKAVVFGHAHQVSLTTRAGVDCYGTPSTWRQYKPGAVNYAVDILPPAYRVLALLPGGRLATHVEFVSTGSGGTTGLKP